MEESQRRRDHGLFIADVNWPAMCAIRMFIPMNLAATGWSYGG